MPDFGFKPVAKDRYEYMLCVLPPERMSSNGFLVGEPYDACPKTGEDRFAAFFRDRGKFYESTRPLTVREFEMAVFASSAMVAE